MEGKKKGGVGGEREKEKRNLSNLSAAELEYEI